MGEQFTRVNNTSTPNRVVAERNGNRVVIENSNNVLEDIRVKNILDNSKLKERPRPQNRTRPARGLRGNPQNIAAPTYNNPPITEEATPSTSQVGSINNRNNNDGVIDLERERLRAGGALRIKPPAYEELYPRLEGPNALQKRQRDLPPPYSFLPPNAPSTINNRVERRQAQSNLTRIDSSISSPYLPQVVPTPIITPLIPSAPYVSGEIEDMYIPGSNSTRNEQQALSLARQERIDIESNRRRELAHNLYPIPMMRRPVAPLTPSAPSFIPTSERVPTRKIPYRVPPLPSRDVRELPLPPLPPQRGVCSIPAQPTQSESEEFDESHEHLGFYRSPLSHVKRNKEHPNFYREISEDEDEEEERENLCAAYEDVLSFKPKLKKIRKDENRDIITYVRGVRKVKTFDYKWEEIERQEKKSKPCSMFVYTSGRTQLRENFLYKDFIKRRTKKGLVEGTTYLNLSPVKEITNEEPKEIDYELYNSLDECRNLLSMYNKRSNKKRTKDLKYPEKTNSFTDFSLAPHLRTFMDESSERRTVLRKLYKEKKCHLPPEGGKYVRKRNNLFKKIEDSLSCFTPTKYNKKEKRWDIISDKSPILYERSEPMTKEAKVLEDRIEEEEGRCYIIGENGDTPLIIEIKKDREKIEISVKIRAGGPNLCVNFESVPRHISKSLFIVLSLIEGVTVNILHTVTENRYEYACENHHEIPDILFQELIKGAMYEVARNQDALLIRGTIPLIKCSERGSDSNFILEGDTSGGKQKRNGKLYLDSRHFMDEIIAEYTNLKYKVDDVFKRDRAISDSRKPCCPK